MAHVAPHLSPHLIAKSLDTLQAWQLPDEGDFAGAHRDVLKALGATEALAGLELPLDVAAPSDARSLGEWDMVANLLARAESALLGASTRQRIAHLYRMLPGHATQLERMRRHAADRLHRLRARVDFVCQTPSPTEPADLEPSVRSARSSLLQ